MHSFSIKVPGDFSSAIFLIVQTLLTKKSSLLIKSVCVNENRIGAYYILKAMGAKIKMLNKRKYFNEDIADLFVHSSKLKGIVSLFLESVSLALLDATYVGEIVSISRPLIYPLPAPIT